MSTNQEKNWQRNKWGSDDPHTEIYEKQCLNLISYGASAGKAYSIAKFPGGYQSAIINDKIYPGMKNIEMRFERIDQAMINFNGKRILDIGCNQGSMIFSLRKKIKSAVGVDFDYRLINTCNLLKLQYPNFDANFFVMDLDKDPHELLFDFVPGGKVDIVFLLRVCKWIRNWKKLISFLPLISPIMIYEANGKNKNEQIDWIYKNFSNVKYIEKTSNSKDAEDSEKSIMLIAKS